jgi:hypothetical protein
VAFLAEGVNSAFEGALVDVGEDLVIDFRDGGEGALAEAGDGADGELAIGGGDGELVGAAVIGIDATEAELEADALEEALGAAGMAGGTAADGDGVIALGFEVEESVEGGDGEDAGGGDAGAGGEVLEELEGEVLVGLAILEFFEDGEEHTGAAFVFGDEGVDELLVFAGEGLGFGCGDHGRLQSG